MEKQYVCPVCHKGFTRSDNMKVHLETIHAPDRINKKNCCPICQKVFTRICNMKKHQENVHGSTTSINVDPRYQTLISKINELQSELREVKDFTLKSDSIEVKELKSELKEIDEKLNQKIDGLANKKPTQINQILNVICVTNHDDYLDMLTDRLGDFDQAIDYIKDCALSDLSGDCRLIEKIYKNLNDELSFSIDHKKSKITYQNEFQQAVTENKDQFGRKLAHNLQNSYLKGVNYLINNTLEGKYDPNKLLDDYDIMAWNTHIYQLSDSQHQRKIISHLDLRTTKA